MSAKPSHVRDFIFILAVTVFLSGSSLLAAEKGSGGIEPRYRVFALKYISFEQVKKYLDEAKLGTVSQLPTTNMILVTAQQRQLVKASAIIRLIDSKTPYVMKALFPASAAARLRCARVGVGLRLRGADQWFERLQLIRDPSERFTLRIGIREGGYNHEG